MELSQGRCVYLESIMEGSVAGLGDSSYVFPSRYSWERWGRGTEQKYRPELQASQGGPVFEGSMDGHA